MSSPETSIRPLWRRARQLLLAAACVGSVAAIGCSDAPAPEVSLTGAVQQHEQRASNRSFLQAPVPSRLRTDHTATLLTDGRVLLVGGNNSGGTVDGSAELYDPATGASAPTKPLGQARWGHTATLLPDGRVLCAGGYVDNVGWPTGPTPTDTSEIFDPETETFSAGPTLSVARGKHTATRLQSNKVLIAGGGAATGEIFDPSNDTLAAALGMTALKSGHTAALLADGRVLLVGVDAATGDNALAELFDPAANGGAGAFADAPAPLQIPNPLAPSQSSLTTLRDGRVLVVGGCPCATMGGATFSMHVAELFDPAANGGVGAWFQTGNTVRDRLSPTATLLPSGQVLVAGSWDSAASVEQGTAELFDPSAGTFTELTQPMSEPHWGHTATLLPSGDVMLFGGDQAAVDLYVGGGSASPGTWAPTGSMQQGRRDGQTGTRLASGEVLIVGGYIDTLSQTSTAAELYQASAGAFAATGALSTARNEHTATLLHDGRVLIAGGTDGTNPLQTAELYDRSANGGQGAFVATTGSMTVARHRHSATLLSDGRVLLAGGGYDVAPLSSAEIYDPTADSFAPVAAPMLTPLTGHAAALLPTGQVLLVGGNSAEVFDQPSETCVGTGAPGAHYVTPRLSVLPSGNVMLTGSFTFAAEIYDPIAGSFHFSDAGSNSLVRREAVQLLGGQVLIVGGEGGGGEPPVVRTAELFDSLGGLGLGAFHTAADMGSLRSGHSATVLTDGRVLVTGGVSCRAICPPTPFSSAELWTPSIGNGAWRPVLSSVPAVVQPGELAAITGSGLRGPEASAGGASNSPSNHPVAVWQPDGRAASIFGSVTDWTDTSANWHVPTTALYGKGWLSVVVDGIPSVAVPVEIQAAAAGIGCQFGAECATGFCADGVCCDTLCNGPCEGCTAARKGQGADGACGPVAPELDPNDQCVLSQGAPCTVGAACATDTCADGVCCDVLCTGQCEACDVAGSVGVCVPVLGAPHGNRPPCDGSPPADPCDTGRCDGSSRTQCAGTIGPCSPYACTTTGCLDSCTQNSDCATGYHCDAEGACVSGLCDGAVATTADGQVIDCTPYKCQPDGSCRTNCGDVSDCADPYACDFQGRCVARPPADMASSGCGCRLAGAADGTRPWVRLSGLLLGLGAIGRRSWRRRAWREASLWLAPCPKAASARRGLGALSLVVLGAWLLMLAAAPARAQSGPPAGSSPASAAAPAGAAPASAGAAQASAAPAEAGAADADRKDRARERFTKGLALTKEGAWAAALAEFIASRSLHPTRVAASNAAFCYRKLQRYDESLATYEGLLRDYPDLPAKEKEEVQRAVSELRPLVGTIDVDAAEPGAAIVVDGSLRGTYPLTAPLRISAGSHIVRVHKEGFEPFETRVDLAGGNMAKVQAKLNALTESGRLKVTESAGRVLDVVVDNVVVGKTPWEGMLSLGEHTVRLRGEGSLGTQPSSAPVKLRQTTALALKAEALEAGLRVEPTPANATVVIDSVTVGRGVWEGALRVGPHKLEVAAEGFLPATRELTLGAGETGVQSVELARDEDTDMWRVPPKVTLELSGAPAIVPSFFGDVVGACGGDCSRSVGIGVQFALNIGAEFSNGFGVGLMAGFLTASQSITGRTTWVTPVGLTPREGSADDSLRMRGPFVGASGWYTLGDDYPLMFRLSAGPLFAWVRDDRTGSFPLNNGGSYRAGPVSVETYATYLHIDPEIRIGIRLVDHLVLSAGVQGMVLIALSRPQWDPTKEIDAAIDGIGAFGNEGLTGPALLVLTPGIGARYEL